MCVCGGEKVVEGWSDVPRSEKAVAMERRVQVIGLVPMTGRRNSIRFLGRARCETSTMSKHRKHRWEEEPGVMIVEEADEMGWEVKVATGWREE